MDFFIEFFPAECVNICRICPNAEYSNQNKAVNTNTNKNSITCKARYRNTFIAI